jgi:hypothetical protein
MENCDKETFPFIKQDKFVLGKHYHIKIGNGSEYRKALCNYKHLTGNEKCVIMFKHGNNDFWFDTKHIEWAYEIEG